MKSFTISRRGEVEELRRIVLERIGPRDELDVLDQIRSVLPRRAIVCNDPTTIVFWARFYWPAYEPRTWLLPAGLFRNPNSAGQISLKRTRPTVVTITLLVESP